MAAPVVTGAVALLLERSPGLSPDQIRQLLVTTATSYPGQADPAGLVNIPAAVAGSQHPPQHPKYGPLPVNGSNSPDLAHTLVWDGGNWGNVFWSAAHWDAAHWDTAHWDAAYLGRRGRLRLIGSR
jgi:subtilisin family serine protease